MAVLVEVNSETDFVARDDNFGAYVEKVVNKAFDTKQGRCGSVDGRRAGRNSSGACSENWRNISVRRVQVVGGLAAGGWVLMCNGNLNCRVGGAGRWRSELAKDVAMHVAAVNPLYLDQIPQEAVDKERRFCWRSRTWLVSLQKSQKNHLVVA